MSAEIVVSNAVKVFGSGSAGVPALQDITATVPEGQFLCLLGPSGCGKSTLLNAMAGFTPLTAGAITVGGQPVRDPSWKLLRDKEGKLVRDEAVWKLLDATMAKMPNRAPMAI